MLWTDRETLTKQDIEEALLPPFQKPEEDILNRPLEPGFNLPDLLGEIARHYLNRALEEASRGTKKEAAELVGLPSYQTFTNWAKKYGVKIGT